jgi:DNA-binding beta-propeller fold protein YncE
VKISQSVCCIAGISILLAPLLPAETKAVGNKNAAERARTVMEPRNLIWPLPPDPPRIRWLTEYTNMAKVKGTAAKKRGWLEKLTGTKTAEEKLELRKPYGITTDSWGRIYVADTELKVVFLIDPEAKAVARRGGTSNAPMALPAGVAVDSQNRLFVSDAQLRSITCFSPTGDVIARFGTAELGRPGGIAIDRLRKRLYVADAQKGQIAAFDTDTFKFIGHFGTPSKSQNPENGTFAGPSNVAVDRQGNIYISDTLNCRVQILDPEGRFLRAFGRRGDRPGEFIRPKGIAVDSEGHVYVADAEFNNFQVLSQNGQPLLAVGILGTDPGEFGLIAGLYIDSQDRIYATEMYIGRVQVFQYISQPETEEGKGVVKTINHSEQDTGMAPHGPSGLK